jgi:hypothetical protein
MKLDRGVLIEAGVDLAVGTRMLQDAIDQRIENYPEDEDYKKMRGFLVERQEVLYNLLNLIPE